MRSDLTLISECPNEPDGKAKAKEVVDDLDEVDDDAENAISDPSATEYEGDYHEPDFDELRENAVNEEEYEAPEYPVTRNAITEHTQESNEGSKKQEEQKRVVSYLDPIQMEAVNRRGNEGSQSSFRE